MKKIVIWDKVTKIKDTDAEIIIKELGILENDEVFLVLDNSEVVERIEISRIIKEVYNLDVNLSVEEVASEYLRIKEEEEEKNKTANNDIENQNNEMNKLKLENEKLRLDTIALQDAVNEILYNKEIKGE